MDFLEYLNKTFGKSVAFDLKDIKYNSDSYDTIKKRVYKLVQDGKLMKLYRGIYYLPEDDIEGFKVYPSFEKYLEKRYIKDGDKQIGYIYGANLENGMGLSTQVPNVYEIVSNKEKSASRIVFFGKHKVFLKRPYTKITTENHWYLQFLELLRGLSEEGFQESKKGILKFYKKKKIDLKGALPYLSYYPSKVTKRYLEMMKNEIIWE